MIIFFSFQAFTSFTKGQLPSYGYVSSDSEDFVPDKNKSKEALLTKLKTVEQERNDLLKENARLKSLLVLIEGNISFYMNFVFL